MTSTGMYLYAITRHLDPGALRGVRGLSDQPLEVVDHRGLSAVVSPVGLDEYGEDGLRDNLERMDWLERTARTHDEVVHQVAALGPTAPLRLATICLDEAGVCRRLDEWYDALEQVLDRVEGRMEWSVKVIQPPAPAAEPAGAPAPALTGAEYLRRKQSETESRSRQESDLVGTAERVHETLFAHAEASRRLPAQDPRLTGLPGTMALNGAYLVDVARAEEFTAAVSACVAAHPELRIEVGGPWPPYSFTTLEQR